MSEADRKRAVLYAALVALLVAAVAAARFDLVAQAFHVTLKQWSKGGAVRWKLAGEIVLFSGILLATWRTLPQGARPARDATIAFLALILGWAAETWGTRHGLWTYYTRESPPLWILPAWPLGALMIDRVSRAASGGFPLSGSVSRVAYWTLSAACIMGMLAFALSSPDPGAALAGLGVTAAALLIAAEPSQDAWPLACGVILVFFADLWGVTNHCWSYHTQAGRSASGAAAGIGFAMVFDSSLVIVAMKVARRLPWATGP